MSLYWWACSGLYRFCYGNQEVVNAACATKTLLRIQHHPGRPTADGCVIRFKWQRSPRIPTSSSSSSVLCCNSRKRCFARLATSPSWTPPWGWRARGGAGRASGRRFSQLAASLGAIYIGRVPTSCVTMPFARRRSAPLVLRSAASYTKTLGRPESLRSTDALSPARPGQGN